MTKTLNITHQNCSTLVLRLALNATARACAKERGLPRRALVSSQGKSCSVALLGLAFTMAEILLSLTIIGVVAAITLPSLMANINERTWKTQRKALYARMSQAIAMMPQLGGYGTLTEDESGSVTADTAAETFLTEGLSKVLKINNICDSEHLADCGIPSSVKPYSGDVITPFPKTMQDITSTSISFTTTSGASLSYYQINTKAAAFETQNGESIAVFYNPNCISEYRTTIDWRPSQITMCANFVYDLNGSKGPNAYGDDIGSITAFYPIDSNVVAPLAYKQDYSSLVPQVASEGNMSAAMACTAQSGGEYRLPTSDELAALYFNTKFLGNLDRNSSYWSSDVATLPNGSIVGVHLSTYAGSKLITLARTSPGYVRCVKR